FFILKMQPQRSLLLRMSQRSFNFNETTCPHCRGLMVNGTIQDTASRMPDCKLTGRAQGGVFLLPEIFWGDWTNTVF
ncbi:MAG: hypothetical protein ACRC36_01230, partial [Lacrimispora sphenoides]